MASSFNDPDIVIGTAPAVAAKDFLSLLVKDESDNSPFTLTAGQGLKIYKTDSPNPDILLVDGTVPGGTTWVVRLEAQIEQSPPVPLAPTVSLVAPEEASSSDLILIQGEHFDPDINSYTPIGSNTVTVDGYNVQVLTASSFELECLCPPNIPAANGLPVIVTCGGLSSITYPTNPDAFVNIVGPELDDLSPVSGRVSAQITLLGQEFSSIALENDVFFIGAALPATIVSADKDAVVVLVPKDAANGVVEIQIGPNSDTSAPVTFTRLNHTITSVTPPSGSGDTQVGDPITIHGTNFSDLVGDHVVTFNGTVATVLTASATALTMNVPMGATSGPLVVDIGGVTASIAFVVDP